MHPSPAAHLSAVALVVNSRPVAPAAGVAGRSITTLAGLGTRAALHPVGAAGLHRRAGRALRLLPQRHGDDRRRPTPAAATGYGELVAGAHTALLLDLATPVKDTAGYTLVGTRQPRLDIPAKATDEQVFVHDMRMPGMLHGRVVRSPYAGADHGDFIGNSLDSVDEASITYIPGIRAVVVVRDFVGIVAKREEHAEQALRELQVRRKPWPGMPDLSDLEHALRTDPATHRPLIDEGAA